MTTLRRVDKSGMEPIRHQQMVDATARQTFTPRAAGRHYGHRMMEPQSPLTGAPQQRIPPVVNRDSGPLSAAQTAELATAARRFRKIRTMARHAFWGSFTSGFIGLASIYVSIGSVSGVAISVAMVISAAVQFRAARQLKRLEPNALEQLAWNQIVLGGLFVLYGTWCLLTMSSNNGQIQQLLAESGAGSAAAAQVAGLTRLILGITDGVLIVFGLFFQGGAGLYYFWRRKYLAAFQTETPAWIIDLYRNGDVLRQ